MIEKRIYYHDTDAGGVVYYANYLKFLEEDRTEFLEQKGISIKEMHQNHFFYAVRQCSISYKSPARYGDVLRCESTLKKMTAAQLIFDQKIYEKETRRLILEAEVTLVSLDKDFKPTPIPERIKALLV
ncbi:MAG: YbgC/FadM family acyl-CoA thioesterase [Candidatus Omnitrophica bacterium]|nr:YbgC/FadM family acyl-CoA thioesterase [Candidatus Omnitrophota bacterium]